MRRPMTGFLSTLNPEQREAALTPFEGDESVGTAVGEIPQDVRAAAEEVCSQIAEHGARAGETVARAIIAERERMEQLVENFPDANQHPAGPLYASDGGLQGHPLRHTHPTQQGDVK